MKPRTLTLASLFVLLLAAPARLRGARPLREGHDLPLPGQEPFSVPGCGRGLRPSRHEGGHPPPRGPFESPSLWNSSSIGRRTTKTLVRHKVVHSVVYDNLTRQFALETLVDGKGTDERVVETMEEVVSYMGAGDGCRGDVEWPTWTPSEGSY